jgi:hypothetical protein
MDINYELIIKYLAKKEPNDKIKKDHPKTNNFITQKNIFNYSSSFPDKFKDNLTDKFYRYGILVYDNEKNNISFWSSLLTLIDKNFIIPYNNDELELIGNFKNQLIEKYTKSKLSHLIKELDKNDLRERFKLEPDVYVLQYIVDTLDINMLIWDFVSETINIVYPKDIMNPWKQTLMIAKYNTFWEPIMVVKNKGQIQRLFDYNDLIIKKLYSVEGLVNCYQGDKINKQFIFYTNVDDVVKIEKTNLKIEEPKANILLEEESDSDSDSSVKTNSDDVFVEADELEEIKKLNKTKINKMKVAELLELCEKLKITITKKSPTKAILVDSIMSKIK